MTLHPTWQDIAVRLLLTILVSASVGLNRGVRGHAAGLRTTILVGLAACAAMIQANLLLSTGGKTPDGFGLMDVMRLPLGILTGVGFIGGGAILKRGDLVTGVTTAATLWAVTVIGLCFGGGQLGLGLAAAALAGLTIWSLKWIDIHMPREQRAILVLEETPEFTSFDLKRLLGPAGYRVRLLRKERAADPQKSRLRFEVRWTRPEAAATSAELLDLVEKALPIISFELASEISD